MRPERKKENMSSPIVMPNPLPVPLPGGGGTGSYEDDFNRNYMQTRNPLLWDFFNGRPGCPGDGPQLTQPQSDALADSLFAQGVAFDEQIDYWGWEAYSTNYQRTQIYGFNRMPDGTGTKQGGPVNPADFVGPVIPGYHLVSVNIADYPPFVPAAKS
jgi:hypothetical protein